MTDHLPIHEHPVSDHWLIDSINVMEGQQYGPAV